VVYFGFRCFSPLISRSVVVVVVVVLVHRHDGQGMMMMTEKCTEVVHVHAPCAVVPQSLGEHLSCCLLIYSYPIMITAGGAWFIDVDYLTITITFIDMVSS